MKILVTGAAGMLGSSLVPTLRGDGHKVYPTDIETSNEGMEFLDVRDIEEVFNLVKHLKPDLIMHLAAETDVDRCELEVDHAFMTNTIGTQNVALACQESNAIIVYISSAGVFDGEKKEPYTEFDEPNPINIYGKTKLEGEKVVKRLLNRYFIVRAGWMIGGGEKDKKFVAKIIKQIDEGAKELHVVTDKLGTPTYAPDFSKVLARLIITNQYGLYHLACKGSGTRYDVAKKILELLGRTDIKLTPVTSDFFSETYPAPRPHSEMMCNFMLDLRGMNTMRSWDEALKEYIELNFKGLKRFKPSSTRRLNNA